MRKLSIALLALSPAAALAAPTLSSVGSIDVSAVGSTPVDIVFDGTNAYFAEFDNARVGRITTPTNPGTAAVTTLFGTETGDSNLAGFTPVTFGAGAGLTSLDLSGNTLLVSGSLENNPGTAGNGLTMTVDITGPTLIAQQAANLDGGSPLKVSAASFFGATPQVVGSFNNGTHFSILNAALASFAWKGDGANGSYGRFQTDSETYDTGAGQELYIAGNSRFFNIGADLGGSDTGFAASINIRRFNPGSDVNDFNTSTSIPNVAGLTMGNGNPEGWYALKSVDDIADNAYQGVGIYNDGVNVWIMLANTLGNEVIFVDRATGASTGTLAVTAPTDMTMITVSTVRYLLVSQQGGTIAVYQEGALNVENWNVYE